MFTTPGRISSAPCGQRGQTMRTSTFGTSRAWGSRAGQAVVAIATVFFVARAHTAVGAIGEWTYKGPDGGLVNALIIDPLTPTTLYAGTDGGLYKSTNGGSNWSAPNSSLRGSFVSALTIDTV